MDVEVEVKAEVKICARRWEEGASNKRGRREERGAGLHFMRSAIHTLSTSQRWMAVRLVCRWIRAQHFPSLTSSLRESP
jgi:hypothetical protein